MLDEARCCLKTIQGQTEGPGSTLGIWSEVVELKVGQERHVLPWQAHTVELQVVGVTTGQSLGYVLAPAGRFLFSGLF